MKYELFVDEYVSLWRRNDIEIEADSKEEVISKYKDGDYELLDSYYLVETESMPKKYEIYNDETEELLYSEILKE